MGEAKTRIIDEEHCFVSSCNINGEKVMEAKQGIPLKSVKRSAIDEKHQNNQMTEMRYLKRPTN